MIQKLLMLAIFYLGWGGGYQGLKPKASLMLCVVFLGQPCFTNNLVFPFVFPAVTVWNLG